MTLLEAIPVVRRRLDYLSRKLAESPERSHIWDQLEIGAYTTLLEAVEPLAKAEAERAASAKEGEGNR